MRRRWVICVLAVAMALATCSAALAAPADSGIELAGGSGRSVLTLRGAVLGTLEVGRITVSIRAGDPQVIVQGEDWQRLTDDGIIYGGRDIRFRIFRGSWKLVVNGTGINASAVGSGVVGLRGEGRYSIDGAPYQAWPEEFETIRLSPDL